jgi:hypothetical protein
MDLPTRYFRPGRTPRARPSPPGPNRDQYRARPQLEALEDRTLLNNRFVVPIGVIPDNGTTFTTLQAALTTPGLVAGDVIQIEPGSAPGNIVNANLPALANITIQGDLLNLPATLPAFGINDGLSISAVQAGFTLRHVNATFAGGSITFNANGTIIDSLLTNNTFGTAISTNLTTGVTISSNTIVSNNGGATLPLIMINPAAGANELIDGNTFVTSAALNQTLLQYTGASAISDRVSNNTFIGNPGSFTAPLMLVQGGVTGLTVTNNTFKDSNPSRIGFQVTAAVQNLTFSNNTVTLTGVPPAGASGPVAVSILGGGTGVLTSANIVGNRLDTGGNGTGLQISTSLGGVLSIKVEANDFRPNTIGVNIIGNAGGAVTGVDLGRGPAGSRGANNFRSFTTDATPTSGAVVTNAPNANGPIDALANLYAVSDPNQVDYDANHAAGLADVVESGPLGGNAAYVQELYVRFLHRAGDLNSSSDAGGWVARLNSGLSRSAVANAVIRSPEGLGILVNSVYRKYLNRDADPGGKASYVAYLQRGGSLEGVLINILGSQEYRDHFSSNTAYVQSLFNNLLGRLGSTGDIAAYVAQLSSSGAPSVVNAFVKSPEYRGIVIRSYYSLLLNRPNPSGGEVAFWVNSGNDLLSIEVIFASTQEFFTNG